MIQQKVNGEPKRTPMAEDVKQILTILEKVVDQCSEIIQLIVPPQITIESGLRIKPEDFEGMIKKDI